MTDLTASATGADRTPELPEPPGLPPLVELAAVTRTHGSGRTAVHALRGVDLRVADGELVVVRGRSGSGKTTLLGLVGGLDRPTAGTVRVAGTDLGTLSDRKLIGLRRAAIGFVFQSFGLVPFLSAAENAGLPLRLTATDPAERRTRVAELLDVVGLADRADHRPGELSGGEQQRVAIARALASRPRLLIADEPTGHLDADTGLRIMRLLRTVVDRDGIGALVATHDARLAELADTVLDLHDGLLERV
ncbi:MAG: ABC transporter ATP-binding protein [Catenulispora sp.]|nr:ABC transporter ATP-binding protein [Catenulispora sp.]